MVRTLKKGDHGEDVKQLQIWLNSKGIDCGPVDGYFGPITEAAVVWFQAMCGVTMLIDGIVGPITRDAMSKWRTMKRGNNGGDIKSLQGYLLETNFYIHAALDGYFGPITETAVKNFQRKVRIIVDGIVGPQTIKAMYHYKREPPVD